jgi:hypothetical protein
VSCRATLLFDSTTARFYRRPLSTRPKRTNSLGAFISLLIFTAFMAVLFSVLSFKVYKAAQDKETHGDEKLREFVMAAFTYVMNGDDNKLKEDIRDAVKDAINKLTERKPNNELKEYIQKAVREAIDELTKRKPKNIELR